MKLRITLLFPLSIAASLPCSLVAQEVIHLWPNGAPGFESRKDMPEEAKDYWVRSINNPSVTVYLPAKDKANGCAVVVAPGGGFRELVFGEEGTKAARYLNSLGVAAFALKYRLPNQENSPYTMGDVREDAYRAIRLVRSRAADFGVDSSRVGILGFSAGGALVNMVAYDKAPGDPSSKDPIEHVGGRPDFVMMVYPGGEIPSVVPPDAPPAFLICATDDDYHCDAVALKIYEMYRAANAPVEAHFIVRGRHAFNMGERSQYAAIRGWPNRMADWLGDSGLLGTSRK